MVLLNAPKETKETGNNPIKIGKFLIRNNVEFESGLLHQDSCMGRRILRFP